MSVDQMYVLCDAAGKPVATATQFQLAAESIRNEPVADQEKMTITPVPHLG